MGLRELLEALEVKRTVSDATAAYQQQLEAVRARAGAADMDELLEDLRKARREMEAAWLEAALRRDWKRL